MKWLRAGRAAVKKAAVKKSAPKTAQCGRDQGETGVDYRGHESRAQAALAAGPDSMTEDGL